MTTKKRMTKGDRLMLELARTANDRASGGGSGTPDPLPDNAVEHRFVAWSNALRAVVVDALGCGEGEWVDEWTHNPDCDDPTVFAFHFCMRMSPLGYSRPMFVRVNLRFHSDFDLQTELARLRLEVHEYRECTNRMYRSES